MKYYDRATTDTDVDHVTAEDNAAGYIIYVAQLMIVFGLLLL